MDNGKIHEGEKQNRKTKNKSKQKKIGKTNQRSPQILMQIQCTIRSYSSNKDINISISFQFDLDSYRIKQLIFGPVSPAYLINYISSASDENFEQVYFHTTIISFGMEQNRDTESGSTNIPGEYNRHTHTHSRARTCESISGFVHNLR